MIKQIDWEFHPRQSEALDILARPRPMTYLCYGGAKGGGKTVLGCRWAFMEANDIIDQFRLKPSKTPIKIGVLARQRAVDFNKTTLETWKREIPSTLYKINEQKKEIIIRDTVKYDFGGMDDRGDIEKFNSAEFCRLFVDQAEEIKQDDFGMLRGAMRLKIKNQEPEFKGLLTANPAQCWLKKSFVKNPAREKEHLFFLQALPADNPYLPSVYLENLRYAYRHRPELLGAYLRGEWDVFEGSDIIIPDGLVRAARQKTVYAAAQRHLVVADIARFGDDRTVIGYMQETDIKDMEVYGQKNCHYTGGRIAAMANKYRRDGEPPLIVIDADGLGGPVADDLRAWGFKVHDINSAGTAIDSERFGNVRAEMWWTAGEKFADGDVCLTWVDDDLDTELTVVKYYFLNGRIMAEKKEDVKNPKRYGKSPDLADMYIMGLYGLQFVKVVHTVQDRKRAEARRRGRRRSSMAV